MSLGIISERMQANAWTWREDEDEKKFKDRCDKGEAKLFGGSVFCASLFSLVKAAIYGLSNTRASSRRRLSFWFSR